MSEILNILKSTGQSALNSLLGGYIGEYFAKRANERNLANYVRLMDKQNRYNSPTEQVKRLKDAGLSIGLMYGNGQIGSPSSNPSLPYQQPNVLDISTQVANLKISEAQAKVLENEAKLKELQANKTEAETKNIISLTNNINLDSENKKVTNQLLSLEKDYKDIELHIKNANKENEIELLSNNVALQYKELYYLSIRNDISEATKQAIIENSILINKNLISEIAERSVNINLKKSEIVLNEQQLNNLKVLFEKTLAELKVLEQDRILNPEKLDIERQKVEATLKNISIQEGYYNDMITQGYFKIAVDALFGILKFF